MVIASPVVVVAGVPDADLLFVPKTVEAAAPVPPVTVEPWEIVTSRATMRSRKAL